MYIEDIEDTQGIGEDEDLLTLIQSGQTQKVQQALRRQALYGDQNKKESKRTQLTVAALTFSTPIVDVLFEHKVDMFEVNCKGDTVFHSLVKYAGVYRDKISIVIEMMEYLIKRLDHSDLEKSYGWLKTPLHKRNNDGFTVLQLSVINEVHEIAIFIVNLDGIYCKNLSTDVLIATKIHDITEMDSISNYKKYIQKRNNCICFGGNQIAPGVTKNTASDENFEQNLTKAFIPSISEMLFHPDVGSSVRTALVESEPLKSIIARKWQSYRWMFYILVSYFTIYLSGSTLFCINRRDTYFRQNQALSLSEIDENVPANKLLLVFFLLSSMTGLAPIFILIFTRHIAKRVSLKYIFPNLITIILYSLFQTFVFLDSLCFLIDMKYRGFFLTLALPCGWGFTTLVFRASHRFAYFTALIRKLIIGDLLSFMLIMLFLFIAFSVCLHDLMKYNVNSASQAVTEDDNFYTPWGSMYSLFIVYLGIRDVENLHQARMEVLAYFLYIIFIILSHILLLNALIAQMSNTCSRIYDSRKSIGLIQQLSLIILMEEMFAMHIYIKQIGNVINNKNVDSLFFSGRCYLPLHFQQSIRHRPTSKLERKVTEIQQLIESLVNAQEK